MNDFYGGSAGGAGRKTADGGKNGAWRGKRFPVLLAAAGAVLAAALILGVLRRSADGSQDGEDKSSAETSALTAFTADAPMQSTADLAPASAAGHAAETEAETLPATAPENLPEAFTAGVPEDDPRLPGYAYDADLTWQLYQILANEITNNTDEESLCKSLSREFRSTLDALALQWMRGVYTDEEVLAAIKTQTFTWPHDPASIEHALTYSAALSLLAEGRDMDEAWLSIRLMDTAARFYLFLAVYYSEETDQAHIYLINGLVQ